MNDRIIEAMAYLSYGIYVLTSNKGDEKHGMIASWVSQVSHDPPLVMVAIRKNRRMHPIVKEAGAFALHVLDKDDEQIIGRFKLPSPAERFADTDCVTLETGCPILEDKLAYMDCRLVTTLDTGKVFEAVFIRRAFTWSGVKFGSFSNSRAAAALTIGAAILVPERRK